MNSYAADIARTYGITGSLSEAGPPVPLGSLQRIPATASGFKLGYILTSTGAIAGDARFDMGSQYDSTIHEVMELGANEGEQIWMLVANNTGSDIARGTPVTWIAGADKTTLFYVEPAAGDEDAAQVKGITQFLIPDGKAAFILCKGVGKALAGATVGSGLRGGSIKVDSVARVIAASADEAAIGIYLQDASTDGSLADVYVDC